MYRNNLLLNEESGKCLNNSNKITLQKFQFSLQKFNKIRVSIFSRKLQLLFTKGKLCVCACRPVCLCLSACVFVLVGLCIGPEL